MDGPFPVPVLIKSRNAFHGAACRQQLFCKVLIAEDPVHLAGNPGEKTVFVTEGPLKGDLAHVLSASTVQPAASSFFVRFL